MYIMDGGRDEEWEIWMEWPTWIGPVMADMDRGGKVRQWVGDIMFFEMGREGRIYCLETLG